MSDSITSAFTTAEEIFSEIFNHQVELKVWQQPGYANYIVSFVEKESYLTPVERAIETAWEKNR